MNRSGRILVVLVVLGALSAAALAEGDAQKPAAEAPSVTEAHAWSTALARVGACVGASIAAIAGGIGVGRIGSACIDSIARQPEAARDMFAPMVVAAGMVEVGMLFAIVVCLLSLFL